MTWGNGVEEKGRHAAMGHWSLSYRSKGHNLWTVSACSTSWATGGAPNQSFWCLGLNHHQMIRSKKSSLETLWDDRSDYQRLTLTDQINQPHDKVEECHQRSWLVHQTLPEVSQEKSDTTFSVVENLLVPFFAFSVNDGMVHIYWNWCSSSIYVKFFLLFWNSRFSC